jgi:hypothetical protein
MMSIQETLTTLKGILNPEKCLLAQDATITVTELAKQASLKKINIVSVGPDAFALKLDECGFPGQKAFVAQHDMHRACDAVIFCVVGGEPFILCIELKSSEPNRNDIAQQFRSAHCLLDFLDSLLKNYHNLSLANWPRRYFLFHDQGKNHLAKAPLIERNDNDHPEKALFWPVASDQKIFLRKLIGKAQP